MIVNDPHPAVTWVLADGPDEPRCGASRGPRSKTRCELPSDHISRAAREPTLGLYHLGRSRTGRWYSWPPEVP